MIDYAHLILQIFERYSQQLEYTVHVVVPSSEDHWRPTFAVSVKVHCSNGLEHPISPGYELNIDLFRAFERRHEDSRLAPAFAIYNNNHNIINEQIVLIQ